MVLPVDPSASHLGEILSSLARPSAYPHPVQEVRVVQTHVSVVFLAGPYAYKVKKPVRLDFLDFSTPELREHYCREELRLNRRLAPELYECVVGIGGERTRPRVGGAPVFEHALRRPRP